MKPVRVEREAKQELAAAAAWYEERREGLGLELMAEVDAVRQTLVSGQAIALAVPVMSADRLGVRAPPSRPRAPFAT